jgi:formamidase
VHNRWHPTIPPALHVALGETVTLETRDGFDGQLPPGSTAADLARVALGRSHPLAGPVFVEGAQPGDVIAVEILDVETAAEGVTPVLPGFGLLDLAQATVVSWEIAGGKARSASLPGVAVPGDPFPGILGVAPSLEQVEAARRAEAEVAAAGALVAADAPEDAQPAEAAGGLRTVPPRANGGNLDIRGLVAGSVLHLPVEVPGALLSAGDLHFAQGDGEVCGAAIEVAGAVTLRVTLAPGERPLTYRTPARPQRAAYATTGIALALAPELDVLAAARAAVAALVDRLVDARGLEPAAAYVLCSVAAELRISQIVNAPSPLVSALLPLDVFEDGQGL